METQQILEENIRLKKMIKKLEKNVQTDFLTKLLNKYGLDKSLPLVWSIAQRNKQQITMLMIDVDNFKGYNDTYGHCEGDIILKKIAACIKKCFRRETDLISRVGGEEFLICISEISEDNVLHLAKNLCFEIENLSHITVSIGIAACVPRSKDKPTSLIKSADSSMYEAKKNGKNCVSYNGQIYKK